MANLKYLEVGVKENWRLTEDEVHGRVSGYTDPDATDALLDFGKGLIAANRERTAQLEGKAAMVAGYAVAVLAFLVSREPATSVIAQWPPLSIVMASWSAGLSLVAAGCALAIRSHPWFSDGQWFEDQKGVLDDADALKRCHVLAMHAVNSRVRVSNDWKANAVIAAQMLLLGAGGCLAIWILYR